MEELVRKYLVIIAFIAGCGSFWFIGELWHKPAFQAEVKEDRKYSQPVTIEMYTVINDGITRRVVASKVVTDSVAFIDDGITSREVKVNAVGDSITPEEITELGKTFNHMAWTAAKDRQTEIDNNQEYYTKRIINEEQ